MIGEILAALRNYFVHEVKTGTFTISAGSIEGVDFSENQYYRVVGSVHNDGVYKYPEAVHTDETFQGAIWTLAVPPDVIALAEDIEKYCESNNEASPYKSESWGGYSYSKRTGSNGRPVSWRQVFRHRLRRWRKL